MTYKDNLVVEVKCGGKIMRVKDEAVYLPYGSEYSLLLKNLDSRKASIKIHIDGQDVLDYSSLILKPNSTTELEGFLRGSDVSNKFKFIQKTKQIQDHRGDKIDDGLIRVEFAFEKEKKLIRKIITEEHHHTYHHWNYNNWFSGVSDVRYGSSGDVGNVDITCNAGDPIAKGVASTPRATNMVVTDSLGIESNSQPLADEGITVKGSESDQSFRYGSIGALEPSKVITIQLKGETSSGASIQQPVTVKTKLQCSSCGTKSKSSYKFCPNCGTFLE